MVQPAAWTFVAVIAGVGLFQLALAAGAPLGRFAWGRAHARLPMALRIGSVVSILVYGACSGIVLDRARLLDSVGDDISATGCWVVSGFLSLGVVMNAISRSRPERFAMTPVALVLAACSAIVALG